MIWENETYVKENLYFFCIVYVIQEWKCNTATRRAKN